MSKLTERSARDPSSGPRQGPVLILDPDRQIRALIAEWMEQVGYTSVQASAIGVAPEAAARCDIVLLDVRAPLPTAREMVASVLAVAQRAAVIAMSADSPGNEPSVIEALENQLDVAAVLVKPFDRGALLQALERARTWRL
jgi:DNA-binding response OmpR family regulator